MPDRLDSREERLPDDASADGPTVPDADPGLPANAALADPPDLLPRAAAPASSSGTRRADRLASLAEVFVCSGLPSQLLLALALHAIGWSPLAADGALSLRYVATISLLDTLLIVALVWMLLRGRNERPSGVLFAGGPHLREGLVGLGTVPAIVMSVVGLGWLLREAAPWLHNVPDNPLAALLRTPRDIAVFAVVVVVAGGVREEVQRAFVLHRFRQHLGGATVGLVVFSLAFGLGHVVQGYDAAILTALLGFTWGWMFLGRGSIVAPMVSHASFNMLEVAREVFTR